MGVGRQAVLVGRQPPRGLEGGVRLRLHRHPSLSCSGASVLVLVLCLLASSTRCLLCLCKHAVVATGRW